MLALLLLLLAGCSATRIQLDAQLKQTIQASTELEQVPFFPQKAYKCAPAALATVMGYYGLERQPDDITPYVYLPGRKGSIAPEIIAYARNQQLGVYPLTPAKKTDKHSHQTQAMFQALLYELADGDPILIMQNLAFDWLPQWHYAVVVGYDLNRQILILRSGREKRRIIDFSTFDHTWQRANRQAWIIQPVDKLPRTATVLESLKLAEDFRQTGQESLAAKLISLAEQRWPDDKLVTLAISNELFAAGKYADAGTRLSQLLVKQPDYATGWNNLAYTLLAMGCHTQARSSVLKARKLAPQDANIADSVREIFDKTNASVPEQLSHCQSFIPER